MHQTPHWFFKAGLSRSSSALAVQPGSWVRSLCSTLWELKFRPVLPDSLRSRVCVYSVYWNTQGSASPLTVGPLEPLATNFLLAEKTSWKGRKKPWKSAKYSDTPVLHSSLASYTLLELYTTVGFALHKDILFGKLPYQFSTDQDPRYLGARLLSLQD